MDSSTLIAYHYSSACILLRTTFYVQEARQDLVVVAGGREMLRDAMLRAIVNREIFTANNLLVSATIPNAALLCHLYAALN
jgi:F420-dependent methylenetetrahydromethanopterin dehydrogenase